jgi:hypothetical protein
MTKLLLAAGLALASHPLAAQDAPAPAEAALPTLSLEQRSSLRCGVAFGLIAKGQAEGDARAAAYPAMEPRGREFFVRTMAGLMDDHDLTREQANKLAFETTMTLMNEGLEAREAMMPNCLLLLEASGV